MTKIRNLQYLIAFGAHLREIRKLKNISQEELSYAADIPVSQIGRIERGEVNTTISTVYVLAQALEIHPASLLDFK